MVQKPNVLVLDEPTNHLDLEAIGALVEALQSYEGTVLFVSHDRAFVSALATRILEVTAQGFQDFPGTYAEYLARSGDDHLDAEAVALREKRDKAPVDSAKALSREEQKRLSNRRKQLPARRDEVLAAIERAEQRKSAIEAQWCEPGFYERTDSAGVALLKTEEHNLTSEIAELMTKWEALEAELAQLSSES
jgi:ABC-type multidrug transport system ATPase subunit